MKAKRILALILVICMFTVGCSCNDSKESELNNLKDIMDSVDDEVSLWWDSSSANSENGDQSTSKAPTEEVTTEEPTTEEPTTEEPTTEEPTTQEPTTQEPTTQEPTTEEPTTQKPVINDEGKTPYEAHGRLSVSGTKLVDKYGNPYQLKGASTHGISWFPQYVSYDTFKYLRDAFGVNVVRIAMYTAEYAGYCSGGNKEELKKLVKNGVDAATDLGLYVIVDWHILSDCNPHTNKSEAINFFREMSSLYKDYDNIIYEICNEPNGGTSWSDIKSYANEVIPVIRSNDPNAIIVVGTPTWSQDVDQASYDKITGYDNIMYALHYYAATHKQWLRDKAQTAINNGLALFVTEFSICDASGNGGLDINEANRWLELLNNNGISFVGWNLSNKGESSAMFQTWTNKISGFDDSELSEWAKWLRDAIKK